MLAEAAFEAAAVDVRLLLRRVGKWKHLRPSVRSTAVVTGALLRSVGTKIRSSPERMLTDSSIDTIWCRIDGFCRQGTGPAVPADFPPEVDPTREFVKRALDDPDERIEVGVAIVGGGTAGLACANRLMSRSVTTPRPPSASARSRSP